MARLAAKARCNYYPLPDSEAELIRTGLIFPDRQFSALDPCANNNGRLTGVQYSLQNGDTVTDIYCYNSAGAVTSKSLQVSRPNGGVTATGTLTASFSDDNEGRLQSITYPAGGPTYTYSYNSLGQLTQMTDQLNNVWVNNLLYGPANEVKQLAYFGATETLQYNSLVQLTSKTDLLGGISVLNMQYNCSGSQNNGKIASQTDVVNGEQVQYAYDSLNRLSCAYGGGSVGAIGSCATPPSGSVWGQGYNYDSFGSLTAKTVLAGSVPTMSVGVDPATNRLIGYSYDGNGNMTSHPTAGTLTYDPENRLLTAASNAYKYGYDSNNKRIWASTPSGESYYLYGPGGRQLGKYIPSVNGTMITFTSAYLRAYFGKRLVSQDGIHPVIEDRPHSMRVDALRNQCSYFPYGEDKGTACTNDQVKFATYTRDSGTLLDYADQRFYTWNYGRFLTPDPSRRGSTASAPQSWNRYGYAQADPINGSDPTGLDLADFFNYEDFGWSWDGGGGGGGDLGPGTMTQLSNSSFGDTQVFVADTSPCYSYSISGCSETYSTNIDVALNSQAQAVINQIAQNNPQGLVNAFMVGSVAAGIGEGLVAGGAGLGAGAEVASMFGAQQGPTGVTTDVTFTHFTDAEGASGITGLDVSSMASGQTATATQLQFGMGQNSYLANNPGDIFVTDLPSTASSLQLSQIGVVGVRQSFGITFSGDAAASQGVLVQTNSAGLPSIYTIPGGTVLRGCFTVLCR